MRIRHAIGGNVIVSLVEEANKLGIIIPESAKERPHVANVCFVGKDVSTLTAGDKVIVNRYEGEDFEVDGSKFILMAEDTVLARLEVCNG
jgi:chaperonin GroES